MEKERRSTRHLASGLPYYLNESWNGLDPAVQNSTLTLGTALAILPVAAAGEREGARDGVER